MKMFKSDEYINMDNPNPGKPYRPEILNSEQKAKNLGGMFGLLVAGSKVPYHYHEKRESIIFVLSGEAIEIIEGKEVPIKSGDIMYIPAGEKHMTLNKSDKDICYLEFFTCSPLSADFLEMK